MKRRTSLVAALALLAACSAEPEPLVYVRTVSDLLLDPADFEVRVVHPRVAHSIGLLTPAKDYLMDGAEQRALVLPPPAEVRFSVGEFEGTRVLRLRAGADISAARWLRRKAPAGAFTFEVLVNGTSVSTGELGVRPAPESVFTEWQDLPGADGLELRSGDIVTLRTGVRNEAGASVPAPFGPRIGFGGLRLEQVVHRKRAVATPEAPNLILVVVDTLRRDRLSTYGYARATSPVLDRLAERGTVFENAYSTASWTWPSTASLLTGLQVREHGVENSRTSVLAEDLTTLAEACQDEGLTTAAWSGNPLITPRLGFGQGFEQLTTTHRGFLHTGEFHGEVEAWIAGNANRRFLLYLHLVEPHHPLEPLPAGRALFASGVDDTGERLSHKAHPALKANHKLGAAARPLDELVSAEDRAGISDLYDACVWSADHWLGRILEQVDELGLTDRTLVVFTSDHGEELLERGYLGHARTLHDELVHVPLVIAGPGVPAGLRVPAPVSNRGVAPYLAARAGSAALGPSALFSGEDSGPVLFSTHVGEWGAERGVEILGLRAGFRIVHYAEKKIIEGEPPSFDATRLRSFDLQNDPLELLDTSAGETAEGHAAWIELRTRFEALKLVRGLVAAPVSTETLELLRRIGYVGR